MINSEYIENKVNISYNKGDFSIVKYAGKAYRNEGELNFFDLKCNVEKKEVEHVKKQLENMKNM